MLLLCSERLKNERKRLKLTQQKIAKSLDVSDMTIKRWETGVTAIPSDKLILMNNLGFDVSYILFGESDQLFSQEEKLLILKYRQASLDVKDKMLAALFRVESETSSSVVQNQNNTINGQQIGDNNHQTNHHKPAQKSLVKVKNNDGRITGIKNG